MKDAEKPARGELPSRACSGPPPGVSHRLDMLRSLQAALPNDRGSRLSASQADGPVSRRALSILVAARLRELRALDELARYLHRARIPG